MNMSEVKGLDKRQHTNLSRKAQYIDLPTRPAMS